ncbi:MAG TPA: isocitrate lyase/phosphoenolpyruvate mutase family protein [Pseudonocardiaceae bacterium]
MNNIELAATLKSLHVPGRPLVLANVWDAASAKLVAAAGFPAVATSSVAVAETLGYPDGHGAPVAEMLGAAARIARVVDVPVTVDAEGGYGLPADEFVDRLLATGAVGCNLEDTDHAAGGGLIDIDRQAKYLADVRAAADRAGVPLVLNARIDVVLATGRPADQAPLVAPIVERAQAYLAAGADCVYPIALRDPEAIRQVVAAVAPAPVNTNCPPDKAGIAAAAKLGSGRLSMGGGLWAVVRTGLAARLADLTAE